MAGNAAAALEGIARLLWNTGLGTPGEHVCVCVCAERARSHWLPHPAAEGESSRARLPWAPHGVQGVPALASVPVL